MPTHPSRSLKACLLNRFGISHPKHPCTHKVYTVRDPQLGSAVELVGWKSGGACAYRLRGLGVRVEGFGFRVWGLGFGGSG